MIYKELYLVGDRDSIREYILKFSEENGLRTYSSPREYLIRIISPRSSMARDTLRTLFWGGGSRKYPPNYPLLEIILFKPQENVTQLIFRIREAFRDVGEIYYNELIKKYTPYDKWVKFRSLELDLKRGERSF